MTLDIQEVVSGEYLLNPGLPGPLKGETVLLEFNSLRLQSVILEFVENFSINLTSRKTPHKNNFLLTGLLCKINYQDGEVWHFLKEKKASWEKLGYNVSYMPPLLRSPSKRGKNEPGEHDGLKRIRQPSVMYAYLGSNSIVARITLSDALVHANLIEPTELYGE
jgi:hypothetical protein